jgi:hypothetical protein
MRTYRKTKGCPDNPETNAERFVRSAIHRLKLRIPTSYDRPSRYVQFFLMVEAHEAKIRQQERARIKAGVLKVISVDPGQEGL